MVRAGKAMMTTKVFRSSLRTPEGVTMRWLKIKNKCSKIKLRHYPKVTDLSYNPSLGNLSGAVKRSGTWLKESMRRHYL